MGKTKRKCFIFRLALFSVVFLLIIPSARAVDPIRNFQIDVISIQTSLGTENVTEQNSRDIINKVNAGFDEMGPGLVHFTFRKLHPVFTSPSLLNSSTQVGTLTGIVPKPDPGYEAAILIGIITKNPSNQFAGMAGGSFVLMNGGWTLSNVATLSHELGHNMGLMHANSATCTTQIPIVCEQLEYGDYSTFMGNYLNGYVSQPYIARLSATELDQLRVLPASKRSVAVESGEYKLAPVFSTTSDLPRVLYIPIGNEYAYSVEYRPPVGNDSSLGLTQIKSLTENWYYTNTPSHGLQLRIVNVSKSEYPTLLPKFNTTPRFETALVSDTLSGPQIHPTGKSFTLSDGSILTFVSANETVGATVKLVRPADTEAPKIGENRADWAYSENIWSLNGNRPVKRKNPSEWDFPAIEIPTSATSDNRLVKSLDVEINGKIVQSLTGSAITTTSLIKYQTTEVGQFSVRLIATDYSGNTTSSASKSLVSSYYQLDKPNVAINPGVDRRTSLVISFYQFEDEATYQLTNLSSGTVTSTLVKGDFYKITVSGITRNENFTATLTGVDSLGHTDGGQQISSKVEVSPCNNSECSVGQTWKVTTGNWNSGVGTMSLQELIKNKWVVIKSSKPQIGVSQDKKYPITFDISVIQTKSGKRVYRLVIDKTKVFSKYIGKTFVQIVLP